MKTFTLEISDESLVAQSRSGNLDAFAQIVKRYQVLLCSVAFSATGNVAQSEDIAQEAFIAAWKQLPQLREPSKLKSWLCTIARYRLLNTRRGKKNEPTEPLDSEHEISSEEPLPSEMASQADDEALVWRALELVPTVYREALVLYYREHQSIEHVACLLDLTEETVRQRLSRGRQALQEKVLALLGSTLTRTVPALAFTSSVLSALPLSTTAVVGAAGVSTSVAKGGGLLKAISLGALGGSALAAAAGFAGMAIGNRLAVELTESTRERAFARRNARNMWIAAITFLLGMIGIFMGWPKVGHPSPVELAVCGMAYAITSFALVSHFVHTGIQTQRKIRLEETVPGAVTKRFQYTSRVHLLGLPLVKIDWDASEYRRVRAWFAFGSYAQGILFAMGPVAVAPISIGTFSIGIISFGCVGVGLVSFSALAVAVVAAGGFALGYDALGGDAIALHFAAGGVAWARDFAEGSMAVATHANDAIAFAKLQTHPLFRYYDLMPYFGAALSLVSSLPGLAFLFRQHKLRQANLRTSE